MHEPWVPHLRDVSVFVAKVGWDASRRTNRRSAIEERIDIPGTGHFEASEALNRTECGDDFLSDDLGRLAQGARELQGDGGGDFAEMQIGGRLQRDVGDVERVFFLQYGAKAAA